MSDLSVIPEFPRYGVTRDGEVINLRTDRVMVLTPTLQGELTVGLVKDNDDIKQHRRSVKVLIAQAFVDGWSEEFNTPILLDGDRYNLRADNIRWRPRWFAWKYTNQFTGDYPGWYYRGPILDITSGLEYDTILKAAIKNGTLCENIRMSILDERLVYPTGEKYVYI